jgi:preprotein translocase subunit SecG
VSSGFPWPTSAGLRDTRITRPERLDRLLLILAIAYLLLCGIGLIVLQTGKPGDWSSSTRNECSVFTIARIMQTRLQTTTRAVLAAIIAATEEVIPKWG